MNGWTEEAALGMLAGMGLLLLIVIILLIWMAVLASKVRRLRKSHAKMVGETGVHGLEEILNSVHEHLLALDRRQQEQGNVLQQQERRLAVMKGRVGVHRFNAFSDSGSDLSFSVAIINEEQDGVVITGIHSREQTFLYAKPIDKGQSAYMLSPEEKTAINLALQKG